MLFRDYLRSHPDVREQYRQLKLELASQHRHDRVEYTRRKAPFIERVLRLAREEDRSPS
ncbi:hypothetical protein J6TS7_37390 [Paenibacillus dendritiformis]|nr:hypothetical protein J6TS7_37390 [Paenibacillus dendritiformis]